MLDENVLKAAILDVIDQGDPAYKTDLPEWSFWNLNEDFANRQRLDFAARVIDRYRVLDRNQVIERGEKAAAAGDRCHECGNTPATGSCYYCKAD